MDTPDFNRLSSCHFYGWENGLKTGMYYLRVKPASNAIKYGNVKSEECTDDVCTVCSS